MRMRLKLGAGVLVIAGALLLAACGGGSGGATKTGGSAPASSGGTSITITNFMFEPMSLTVSPGATVKVTNKDSATHTLTASGNQFDTGDIDQNHTKTFTAPMKPGTYH